MADGGSGGPAAGGLGGAPRGKREPPRPRRGRLAGPAGGRPRGLPRARQRRGRRRLPEGAARRVRTSGRALRRPRGPGPARPRGPGGPPAGLGAEGPPARRGRADDPLPAQQDGPLRRAAGPGGLGRAGRGPDAGGGGVPARARGVRSRAPRPRLRPRSRGAREPRPGRDPRARGNARRPAARELGRGLRLPRPDAPRLADPDPHPGGRPRPRGGAARGREHGALLARAAGPRARGRGPLGAPGRRSPERGRPGDGGCPGLPPAEGRVSRTPNLATRPLRNERLPAVLLGLALAVLLAVSVEHLLVLRELLPGRTAAVEGEVRGLEQELAALRSDARSLPRPRPDPRVLAEWQVIRGLVDRRTFSWARLLARLESVLPAGV